MIVSEKKIGRHSLDGATLTTYLTSFAKHNFGWVLWHINPCRLFNAISCLYIYIKYMIFKYFL